jgi:hypothetical protein
VDDPVVAAARPRAICADPHRVGTASARAPTALQRLVRQPDRYGTLSCVPTSCTAMLCDSAARAPALEAAQAPDPAAAAGST